MNTRVAAPPEQRPPAAARLRQVAEPVQRAANDTGSAHLIRVEGELRRCTSREALWQHLVNESIALLPFGQALVLELQPALRPRTAPHWLVQAVSGLAQVQHDAPMIVWYERLVARLWQETEGQLDKLAFELPRFADADDPSTGDAALPQLLWLPLVDAGGLLQGGWLLARDTAWEERHLAVAERLALAYAHGASAIAGRRHPPGAWRRRLPRVALIGTGLALLIGLLPVPQTTVAPVEVAPQDPFVVSAPVAGVVASMLVQPGAAVKPGDKLLQLVDTSLRSDFDVASQRLEVARARSLRLQQAAVEDASAKRELAVAYAEETVAAAERDFAEAMLEKSVIRATRAGVALYGEPRDWVGRPVAVGEAIMRVADPTRVEFQIRVPVADAVNLREGARVRVFLDAAPLSPIEAQVQRAAYKAESDAAGIASFLVVARAKVPTDARLGLRGTARLYGDDVPLLYQLLRRPIVALRQWSGI